MSAPAIAAIFGPLMILAAWGIKRDLATGVARDELYSFRADRNPLGFLVVISGKIFIIGFGAAVILHAFGLMGDPVEALQPIFAPSFSWLRGFCPP
jgi:hypothetical protein